MSEHKLPSGATVTLRDPATITHGDRKRLMAIDDAVTDAERGFQIMDNLLVVAVKEWSFDLIIPSVKRDSLDKLSPADYDAIAELAKPLMDAMAPKTGKSAETEADPKASTDN